MANELVQIRNQMIYQLHDSIVIGRGASQVSGWYENWQDFAADDEYILFNGRSTNAPRSLCNQYRNTRDWAFLAAYAKAEMFITTPTTVANMSNPMDAIDIPALFAQTFARQIVVEMGLGDNSQKILELPLSAIPGGSAPTGGQYDQSGAPSYGPPSNGVGLASNFLPWPGDDPLKLPAGSHLDCKLQMSGPVKRFLSTPNLPAPGQWQVTTDVGATISLDVWYVIRMSLFGLRRTQMPGAMSAT